MATNPGDPQCPRLHEEGDRKSGVCPSSSVWGESVVHLDRNHVRVTGFAPARRLLRGEGLRQAGFKAELLERIRGRARMAVLFQEGEAHQAQRIATARFFAPSVVDTRYRGVMTTLSDSLVASLREQGQGLLDDMSLALAVAVAAEIIGLTDSDRDQMSRRLDLLLSQKAPNTGPLSTAMRLAKSQWRVWEFYRRDVAPAISARRVRPREDLISHLLGQGYSNREILRECLMYGTAGMATTREFIVMAGWYLLERADLRDQFLAGDEPRRIALLEEILRLEPVVGSLYRRAEKNITLDDDGRSVWIPQGTLVEIDVRAVNADAVVAGDCPHRLNPDRAPGDKTSASGISFGDGRHRCPGASVALQESAIFLDRLLRVPGIRLERAPTVRWNPVICSYELRDARLALG